MSRNTTSATGRGGRLAAAGLVLLTGGLTARTTLAAAIKVTTLADSDVKDGLCSLREAIRSANDDGAPNRDCSDGAGADLIDIVVEGRIILNTALPEITQTTTLVGPGESLLSIDAGKSFRLIDFTAGAGETLTVRRVTLERGDVGFDLGGGIRVAAGNLVLDDARIKECAAGLGAGIFALGSGSVRVVRSTLSNNKAGSGGGIFALVTSVVDIEASTFAVNEATGVGGNGGAVFVSAGTLEVDRSTFSGNVATNDGGALAITSSTATVTSATIYQNRADADGASGGQGGGIALNAGVLELRNSIVAGNQDLSAALVHPDISQPFGNGSTVTTKGFNLVGSNASVEKHFPESANPNRPNENGDYVGSAAQPLDPELAVLADNLGPTRTHHPLPESPAIDAGNVPTALADQRGFHNRATKLRAVDDPATPDRNPNRGDIGALEVGAEEPLTGP